MSVVAYQAALHSWLLPVLLAVHRHRLPTSLPPAPSPPLALADAASAASRARTSVVIASFDPPASGWASFALLLYAARIAVRLAVRVSPKTSHQVGAASLARNQLSKIWPPDPGAIAARTVPAGALAACRTPAHRV